MTKKDNRNRLFGAGLILAGVLGLITPPLPALNVCPTALLSKAGIHISRIAPPAPPRAPHAPSVRIISAKAVRACLPGL
ncbi:MAG TPA: hypothetical protein VKW78_17900 [Terriglobales bacterium]|nr:hypothetical protein [Terriglobales bacterium]